MLFTYMYTVKLWWLNMVGRRTTIHSWWKGNQEHQAGIYRHNL